MGLIYIVDDDENLCSILSLQLRNEGYQVNSYTKGTDVIDAFNSKPCDLIISDIMMPEMNGYEVCQKIREVSDVPFIMLSAKGEEIDRILGLELGSDDYITKPFSLREVVIKVNNMMRRFQKNSTAASHVCKDLKLDQNARVAYVGNDVLELTSKEFNLVLYLVTNINQAFSREQLIENIWGYDYYGDTRQVDHMIKRIRKKLIALEAEFRIETVWGYGYKVMDNDIK
jgi:DNA-binding response OmpR family regulator